MTDKQLKLFNRLDKAALVGVILSLLSLTCNNVNFGMLLLSISSFVLILVNLVLSEFIKKHINSKKSR